MIPGWVLRGNLTSRRPAGGIDGPDSAATPCAWCTPCGVPCVKGRRERRLDSVKIHGAALTSCGGRSTVSDVVRPGTTWSTQGDDADEVIAQAPESSSISRQHRCRSRRCDRGGLWRPASGDTTGGDEAGRV